MASSSSIALLGIGTCAVLAGCVFQPATYPASAGSTTAAWAPSNTASAAAPLLAPFCSDAVTCVAVLSIYGVMGLAALVSENASGGPPTPMVAPASDEAWPESCPSPRTCRYLSESECTAVPPGCHCACGLSTFAGEPPAPLGAAAARDAYGWPRTP